MPLAVYLMDVCRIPLRDRSCQLRIVPERRVGRRCGSLLGAYLDLTMPPNGE